MENAFKIPEAGVDESKWLVVGPAQYVALRDRAARMENALQVIMDETQKHHEFNPVSQTARLPMGYRKILNTAHYALNA